MIGQKWASEIRTFKDDKTGRTVRQLTTTGNNVHLYFTENSFIQDMNEIIFLSDRASGEDKAPYQFPHMNLFRMRLDSGEITQLTDEPRPEGMYANKTGTVGSVTKTPDGEIIV